MSKLFHGKNTSDSLTCTNLLTHNHVLAYQVSCVHNEIQCWQWMYLLNHFQCSYDGPQVGAVEAGTCEIFGASGDAAIPGEVGTFASVYFSRIGEKMKTIKERLQNAVVQLFTKSTKKGLSAHQRHHFKRKDSLQMSKGMDSHGWTPHIPGPPKSPPSSKRASAHLRGFVIDWASKAAGAHGSELQKPSSAGCPRVPKVRLDSLSYSLLIFFEKVKDQEQTQQAMKQKHFLWFQDIFDQKFCNES